jgi:hypothetical protein
MIEEIKNIRKQLYEATIQNDWWMVKAMINRIDTIIYNHEREERSSPLTSIDTFDDENSIINKIGREIAEMSDEEFENNCKEISDMLSRSKGNDRI